MEISAVRRRAQAAIAAARERSRRRRGQAAEAERAYEAFLRDVATPITKQLAAVLKAEGLPFTVFTPGGGLRLASDRTRHDYVEFALDTASDPPQVLGRVSRTRGSRTLGEERPIRPDTLPDALTEEDVLAFLVDAIGPWLEG